MAAEARPEEMHPCKGLLATPFAKVPGSNETNAGDEGDDESNPALETTCETRRPG